MAKGASSSLRQRKPRGAAPAKQRQTGRDKPIHQKANNDDDDEEERLLREAIQENNQNKSIMTSKSFLLTMMLLLVAAVLLLTVSGSSTDASASGRHRRRRLATDTAAVAEDGEGEDTAAVKEEQMVAEEEAREAAGEEFVKSPSGDGKTADDIDTGADEPKSSTKAKSGTDKPKPKPREVLRETDDFEVLEELPHDAQAFTQGLTFDGTNLYESTGLYGHSTVRLVDPATGKSKSKIPMDPQEFGEGMTYYENKDGKGRLIQITWKAKKGYIYDSTTLDKVHEFTYQTYNGEGWGITYDEDKKEFIVSDGSEYLMFWDRDSVEENDTPKTSRNRVPVMRASVENGSSLSSHPIHRINELEFYKGTVLANVWYRDVLLQIDPKSGFVLREYDFASLYTGRDRHADCFNGISLTDVDDELWVTGKLWPKMYRIRLKPEPTGDE